VTDSSLCHLVVEVQLLSFNVLHGRNREDGVINKRSTVDLGAALAVAIGGDQRLSAEPHFQGTARTRRNESISGVMIFLRQLSIISPKSLWQCVILWQTVVHRDDSTSIEDVSSGSELFSNPSIRSMSVNIVGKHSSMLQVIQFAVNLGTTILAGESIFSSSRPLGEVSFTLGDLDISWSVTNERRIVSRMASSANGAMAIYDESRVAVQLKLHFATETTTLVFWLLSRSSSSHILE